MGFVGSGATSGPNFKISFTFTMGFSSVFVVVTPLEVGVEAGVAWVDNVGPVDGRAVAPDETDEVDWDPGVVNPGFVGAVVV